MIRRYAGAESLRLLPPMATASNPGAQNAAAGSKELFPGRKGFPRRSSAEPPAVCMVTMVVWAPLVPVTVCRRLEAAGRILWQAGTCKLQRS